MLLEAENNYSSDDVCICNTSMYVFGHHFLLQIDHWPLLTLFNESKEISNQALSRIQRWALFLYSYQHTIACWTTKQHANADAMSGLSLPLDYREDSSTQQPLYNGQEGHSPINGSHMRTTTIDS